MVVLSGSVLFLLGIAIGIALHRLVRQPQEHDLPFKLAMDAAPNGLLLVDSHGVISIANVQIERMFGYCREELLGSPVSSLFPPRDRATLEMARAGSLSASAARPIRKDLCGLRKDGSEFPVEIGLNPVSTASGASRLVAVIDITDRKKVEASLRDASKMAAISALAGGIAHEFNNSLTAVLGFSHLALPLIAADNKAHHYIQQVMSAGMESRELVHQLLTFSRQSDQVRHPLPLHLLVKEALKSLRSTIPSSIELKEQIDVSTRPVLADTAQMHQMIINLAENAVYAMRKTGGILEFHLHDKEIEVDEVTPTGRLAAGTYVCLTVRDAGEGMEPEVADRIFEPFFSAEPLGVGRGMGLSVVHGIVAAHGGTIMVDSQIDVGTVVSVYIPALTRRAAAVTVTGDLLPHGHECILLVVDEESQAQSGMEMLESLGFYPVVRTSGTAAWQAFHLAPHRFDLLIADLTLSDISGDRLAHRCRQLRPDLPVIFCAGSGPGLSEEEARARGIAELVHKPIKLQDLAYRIRRVLDARPSAVPSSSEQPIHG